MLTKEQLFILREEIDKKGHKLDSDFSEWITISCQKIKKDLYISDSNKLFLLLYNYIKLVGSDRFYGINEIKRYPSIALGHYGISSSGLDGDINETLEKAEYVDEIFKSYKKDKYRKNVSGWQKTAGISIFVILLFFVVLLCL